MKAAKQKKGNASKPNLTPTAVHKGNVYVTLFYCAMALVFAKMLVLNFLTPLLADDFGYATSTSVINALQREYVQYLTWSGRSVVHFIARLFLMMPKAVFNIANALVYTVFTIIIYVIADSGKRHNISLYLFIVFSVWLHTIIFGQTVLWLTGSCNYLWGTAIILSFLLPYNLFVSNRLDSKHNKALMIGMPLLGILAGWCNENTSGGMILMVVLIVLYCKIFKQKIQKWMIGGLCGCIIGFGFLIFAPGNFARSQHSAFADNRALFEIILSRLKIYTNAVRFSFTPLIVIFVTLLIVQISLKADWKRAYLSLAYFIASLATVYAMVLSPSRNTGRALFGATTFMIIACAHCLAGLSLKSIPEKVASSIFTTILAAMSAISFISAFHDIRSTKESFDNRHEYITSQIARGNLNIIVPYITPEPQTIYNAMFGLEDLSEDASYWINAPYAQSYGAESIIALSLEEWEKLETAKQ